MSQYNLEQRTLIFAKNVIIICKRLPNTVVIKELSRQLIRSAGSVGANYREANDALGRKDFIHKLRIARKEAKETIYWLELLLEANPRTSLEVKELLNESTELKNILSAIINKSKPFVSL